MSKKKQYNVETELANYILSEFLDPLGGACKYNGIPIPYNFNEVLDHIYSKSGVFEHPFSFTKSKLEAHLFQRDTHYYRSLRNGIHKEGYGGHDERILSILNKYLGIKKSDYKKYDNSELYVLLLKFDHDGHNDEKDSSNVQNWLISNYFEDTYKEPSTSLSGDHGYCKIAYPSYLSIEYVCQVIKIVFTLLDKKRAALGFASPIDVPCGLPNLITWDESISVETPMPKIIYKEYSRYRNIRQQIVTGEITESDAMSIKISNRYTFSNIQNILSIPVPCSIKQSQCGKVPRFISREDPYTPLIDNMISFYHLRYYHFSHFKKLLTTLTEELGEPSNGQGDFVRNNSQNTPCLESDPVIPNKRREEEEGVCNIVRPPYGDAGITEQAYLKIINEKTRLIDNNAARVNSLYIHFSSYLGYVPSVEKAEQEYLRLGLNKSESAEGRQRRFKDGKRWVESVMRSEQRGFTPQGWEVNRATMVNIINSWMGTEQRYWYKGKKRYILHAEELSLIYYAILKSNEADDIKTNNSNKYAFSYKQVRDVFRTTYDKGCHQDKISQIFKILRESELITLIGDFEIGAHGNMYKATKVADLLPVGLNLKMGIMAGGQGKRTTEMNLANSGGN